MSALQDNTSYDFLLYGAYGYTGKLIATLAKEQGLNPLLAGRQTEPLRALAEELGFAWQAFPLDDASAIDAALGMVPVVLHAAGPYSTTAEPMVAACLRTQTHYVDITGEVAVFEAIAAKNEEAQKAGIVLLPGAGFDVVPTDCLGAFVASQVDKPTHLELAFKGVGDVSRGTALTAVENLASSSFVREQGQLKAVEVAHKSRFIDFGKGDRLVASIPWGDLATAYRTTGIPNIITYTATSPRTFRMMRSAQSWGWLLGSKGVQRFLKKQVSKRVTGPSEEVREESRSYIWAEVRNAIGEVKRGRLTCMEGYKLTAHTSLAATLRIGKNEVAAGYHTPTTAFGPDFILDFEGSTRELL